MMPDWTVTMELYLKNKHTKKRSSRNKTKSCQKIDNSEWIKNENKSYFLIVQLVKLNGDSG